MYNFNFKNKKPFILEGLFYQLTITSRIIAVAVTLAITIITVTITITLIVLIIF
jgi:hypothetical protein